MSDPRIWVGVDPAAPGDLWIETDTGKLAAQLKEWREKVSEVGIAAERAGNAVEALRVVMRPHDAWRSEDGVWACRKCGAASMDPDLVMEVECD